MNKQKINKNLIERCSSASKLYKTLKSFNLKLISEKKTFQDISNGFCYTLDEFNKFCGELDIIVKDVYVGPTIINFSFYAIYPKIYGRNIEYDFFIFNCEI